MHGWSFLNGNYSAAKVDVVLLNNFLYFISLNSIKTSQKVETFSITWHGIWLRSLGHRENTVKFDKRLWRVISGTIVLWTWNLCCAITNVIILHFLIDGPIPFVWHIFLHSGILTEVFMMQYFIGTKFIEYPIKRWRNKKLSILI